MWNENIKNRTFGFELEFADGDKTKIELPSGYMWTDNKLTMMNNSDGSAVTHNGQFGGEINTRPYKFSKSDLKELKDFIQSLKDAGSYLMWNEGFDAHFYVKDLGLDVIKRIFALSYYTAFPIKKIFDFCEWWDTKYLAPTPTIDVVNRALAAENIENFLKVFSNSSDRGHIRYWINCVPIERIGTIEFRIFNSSWNFDETLESIKFMYSFVEYAYLHEDIEDYKKLNSIEACVEAFKIDRSKVAQRHVPLPWAAEHDNNVTVLGESFKKSARMMSHIRKVSNNFDCVKIVNSYYTDIEQIINAPRIEVYTKEYFVFILYQIIQGQIKSLRFDEEYNYLDIETEDKSRLIATIFMFNQIKKHQNSQDIYHKGLYEDFRSKLEYYMNKYTERYRKMVSNLENKNIAVFYGYDLDDAVKSSTEKDLVIYQSEFSSNIKATSNALKLRLVDELGYEDKKPTKYAEIDLESVNYILVSQHQFMGREKVMRDNRTCLYSNVKLTGDNVFSKRSIVALKYKRLPDNYEITEKSKLKFIRASMNETDYLRMIYLKKDIILGSEFPK